MSTSHVLDNPVWQALTNQHTSFAQGNDLARRYPPDIALFGGVIGNTEAAYECLAELFTPGEYIGLFESAPETKETWKLVAELALPQMVYDGPIIESLHSECVLTPLTHVDVPAMLQLVELTHPGPFFQRTIEFGGYPGIWQEGQLVAMAGTRLHLPGYREISAGVYPSHIPEARVCPAVSLAAHS